MPSKSAKSIRSIKDNPAGKVVADPVANRWEWQSDEDTARLLRKLDVELEIEKTDLHPRKELVRPRHTPDLTPPRAKSGGRDVGGGFNPYDHSGKPQRR